MIILGIDPGGTTGFATLYASGSTIGLGGVDALSREQSIDFIEGRAHTVDAFAVEKFTITARTLKLSRQPDAMYVIGVALSAAHRHHVNLSLQTPSDAKVSFPDSVLKDLDLWSTSRHTRDATRHALLYARRAGIDVHVSV